MKKVSLLILAAIFILTHFWNENHFAMAVSSSGSIFLQAVVRPVLIVRPKRYVEGVLFVRPNKINSDIVTSSALLSLWPSNKEIDLIELNLSGNDTEGMDLVVDSENQGKLKNAEGAVNYSLIWEDEKGESGNSHETKGQDELAKVDFSSRDKDHKVKFKLRFDTEKSSHLSSEKMASLTDTLTFSIRSK